MQKKILGEAEKKIRKARVMPEGREIFAAPRQNSILPLGQNRQEGGQKLKEEETSNNREER